MNKITHHLRICPTENSLLWKSEHITATLEFDGGVTAVLKQHRFPEVDSTAHGFMAFGSRGRIRWHNTGAWWIPEPHFLPGEHQAQWVPLELVYPDHFDPSCGVRPDEYLYVDDFVRALDAGGEHASNGKEGRHVLEIMMGIFESGAYSRPISLPQPERDHPLLRWRQEAGLGASADMPRPYGEWMAAEASRLGKNPAEWQHRVRRI